MCRPPDVTTPSILPIGRRRDVNPSSWTPDPRTNWGAPPPQAAGSSWPSWVEFFNYPQAGFPKDDVCASNVIDAAPLGSLLASALAQQEVPKTWQPQPNWATPQSNSFYCDTQAMLSSYGGGMDGGAAHLQSTQGPASEMGIATTSSIAATEEPLSLEGMERLKEEDKSQGGPWVEEVIQEGRLEQDTSAKKLCNPSPKIAKAACQKPKPAVRPGVKKETTSPKDVCMLDSDMEGSDDDGEGTPVISEKRRKRMLSNRASAQRSRQRRQERLDTLEVLVAQLRVENAALTRKANSAVATAKKLEHENKVLRERLESKDQNRGGRDQNSRLKDALDTDDQSLQTTGGNSAGVKLPETGTISMKARTGDSDSSSENSDPNKQDGEQSVNNTLNNVNSANTNNARSTSQSSKKSKRSCEDAMEKEWSFNSSFSSVFNSENMEQAGNATCKMSKQRSAPRLGVTPEYSQDYEAMKGVSVILPQTPAFQELAEFDIDLEHSPDIDKKLLESVEEIWMFSDDVCFK
ncbi:protein MpBZIP15 [Marchantia polymorpha subsp. ruderalis]|uniref:BZIP domain-containing protein n=2 Tax=Marchantia polymorpha TaxID=3197 RepID=A0AAF6AL56_MARPO|nr:hypothetical protein MARPO_0737s0001 [Marchantia polymorpha]BBM97176.1 hypothetical protein Mp_1g03580 [Marchantia polymorpha subsp. ruderalis]|eukprot:PTQ26645.1 hypothetical protein MARPO_0737s0001 [Marchantia polymorpha]